MRKTVVCAILLCLAVATASSAMVTQLTSTTRGGFLELDCSWVESTALPGALDFTYTLTNWAANNPIDNSPTPIRAFTLQFPSVIDINSATDFVQGSWVAGTPANWTAATDGATNALRWNTAVPTSEIAPGGGSLSFGFTAFWLPSSQTTTASGIDGAAYSGFTCGPGVIPEASSILLAVMGLSSVAGFRRLFIK